MSILPTFMQSKISEMQETISVIEIPTEYGIDYSTGQLTGEIVDGAEAVKVWAWLCLHTERFRYPIFPWSYGTEFEQYIGSDVTDEYLQSDCPEEIEAALTVNPWISGIANFEATRKNDKLTMKFTIQTTFGEEVDMDV